MYTAAQLAQVHAGRAVRRSPPRVHISAEPGKAMLVFDLSPELGNVPMAILVKDTKTLRHE